MGYYKTNSKDINYTGQLTIRLNVAVNNFKIAFKKVKEERGKDFDKYSLHVSKKLYKGS